MFATRRQIRRWEYSITTIFLRTIFSFMEKRYIIMAGFIICPYALVHLGLLALTVGMRNLIQRKPVVSTISGG